MRHWQYLSPRLLAWVRSPAAFMLMVTGVGALCGFAQVVIVARSIGPTGLGVVAVLSAISASVLNIADLKLTDIASRLYFLKAEDPAQHKDFRASVLAMCVVANFGLSCIASIAIFAACLVLAPHLIDMTVKLELILLNAIIGAVSYMGSTCYFLQRLGGQIYLMGGIRISSQVIATSVFFYLITINPTLDGYYLSYFILTCILTLSSVAALLCIMHWEGLPLFADLRLSYRNYRASIGMIFGTNILGYLKLWHRALDVIVVAWYCNDQVTGIYRLARSITDSFYTGFDAVNQVYFPIFLKHYRDANFEQYCRMTKQMASIGLLSVTTFICIEGLFLEAIVKNILPSGFENLAVNVMIMTIPLAFVLSIWLWAWPAILSDGRLKSLIWIGAASCAFQYSVMLALFELIGHDPIAATLGYVSYYAVMAPGVIIAIVLWSPLAPTLLSGHKKRISSK
jgi:O-antigen/teichoic acid export membrane protein